MTRDEIQAELSEAEHTFAGFERHEIRTETRQGRVYLLDDLPMMLRTHYALKRRVELLRMLLEVAQP